VNGAGADYYEEPVERVGVLDAGDHFVAAGEDSRFGLLRLGT